MKNFLQSRCLLWLTFSLLTGAATASGQVIRTLPKGIARPQAGMTLAGTASVTASPGSTTFNPLVHGGVSTATNGIVLTTKVSGLSLVSSVSLYGYFSSTTALTNVSGASIPSSAVFGQCTTGSPTTFTAFTASDSNGMGAGSSLLIWRTTNLVSLGAGRTDTLSLEINLQGVPQTPAGTYTGTVNFLVEFL